MPLPSPTPREHPDLPLNYFSREITRLEIEKDKLQKWIDYLRELEAYLSKKGLNQIFG